jgi:tetratricopeptide (TPR) repeat protein
MPFGFVLAACMASSAQTSALAGLEVVQVLPGSVAEKAGIRKGDIITSWAGRQLETPTSLRLAIRNTTGRGLVPVRLRGRSISIDPESLGTFPKSPSAFGADTVPAFSGSTREMVLKAWEIFLTNREESAKLLYAASDEENRFGKTTKGVWLSLAAIRTEGGRGYFTRLMGLSKVEPTLTDHGLRAEILNDRYWADPKIGANPSHPEHRVWWYRAIEAVQKGGYPVTAAVMMGVHDRGAPFYLADAEAVAMRRRALITLEKIRESEALQAPTLRNLGWNSHMQQGGTTAETVSGKSAYLRAAKIYEKLGNQRVPITSLTDLTWNIRTDYRDRGLSAEVSFSAVQGQAGALALAALAAFHQFQYTEAEELALKAIQLRDKLKNDLPVGWATYDSHVLPVYVLALTALVRGDLEGSIAWHNEYARLKISDDVTDGQIRIGQLLFRNDHSGKDFADRLVKRNSWGSKMGDWDLAVPYLAGILIKEQKGKEVLAFLEPAISHWRGANKPMWLPQGYTTLGDVKRSIGDVPGALQAYANAMSSAQNRPRANPYTIRALCRWGGLVSDQAQYAEAQKALEEALSLSLLFASQAKGELSRQFAASIVSEASASLVQHYSRTGQAALALQALENSRGRSLATLMASSRGDEASAVWQAYKDAARAFEAIENEIILNEQLVKQSEVEAQTASGIAQSLKGLGVSQDFAPDPAAFSKEAAAAKQKLSELRSRRSLARLELERTSAAALDSARGSRTAFAAESALQALPEGRVFVTYCATPTGVTVLAGSKAAGIVSSALDLQNEGLSDWVARIVKPFMDPSVPMENVDAAAKEGYRTLFPGPVGPIVASAKELVIIPESDLWTLPFAALKTPKGVWLGSSIPITYSLSLSLAGPSQKGPTGTGAMVIGDPIFSHTAPAEGSGLAAEATRLWSGGTPPPPLPATRQEAEDVAKLYGGSPLLGPDATEANLRKRIEQARIIHLATHGYISSEFPLASGVLLTPPASITDAADDGVLQAAEIARRLRLQADLVVLSACETGRGVFLQGEGVQGLVRSLMLAGAKSVVASQWKVADESTKDLMIAFHTRFSKSGASSVSLAEAMKQAQAKRPHPYYWAPFGAYGSP